MALSISRTRRYAIWSCAGALLAGCGGSQPPIGAPGAMPRTAAITTRADRGTSWMRPGTLSGSALLYVAGRKGGLYVFTYPQGQLVGEVGIPYATNSGDLCSDANGDIFVPDVDEVVEFAHGGTQPIATLEDGDGSYEPLGCSVDPTTGNLAVTNFQDYPGHGNVAVYANAQGDPTYYSDLEMPDPSFCGYDNQGNLFIDGGHLAELPNGSGNFANIKLNKRIPLGGQVQWDGTYITVASNNANTIYRLQISGSTGKITGSTHLKGPGRKANSQSWIKGSTIISPIGPGNADDRVGFWGYPGGGKAFTILHPERNAEVIGSTVSVGP
ncbi:MAG: hypothetical protein WA304_05935 [Candidatus Cybelea sp.]